MTRGLSETLPTRLPARYERLFAWELDRRCKVVRDVAADLFELWQDLGGVEALSVQQRWLCERVVYLRRRCVAYEAAVLDGKPPPMDAGVYSNFVNVMAGYLRTLGLKRQPKPAMGLHEFMAARSAEAAAAVGGGERSPDEATEVAEANAAGMAPDTAGCPESPPPAELDPAAPGHPA